jgi:murein L,D-transpeptidase YcbB/YkuD
MVLLRNKDTINPYKVKWGKIKKNSFPYKVVQQPGQKNSLGVLKFEFHSKYDVYFHDTPSKNYFKKIAKTYSHGCIRTENPLELAKIVLELDENPVTADSLDSLMLLPLKHHKIPIKDRIPIFIEYHTVVITPEKEVVLLRDIYFRDDKYIYGLDL